MCIQTTLLHELLVSKSYMKLKQNAFLTLESVAMSKAHSHVLLINTSELFLLPLNIQDFSSRVLVLRDTSAVEKSFVTEIVMQVDISAP